uniref:3',5'-cyclic-GMP phosphodiesterase n=1 Tax=Sarcophilus harrisii TaxID=9305 RepID=A0A7N4PMY9_SARHA
ISNNAVPPSPPSPPTSQNWNQISHLSGGGTGYPKKKISSRDKLSFNDDTSRLESMDITVIYSWEAFNHLELHELIQYGSI